MVTEKLLINIFYPLFGFSYRIIEELTLTFVVLVLLYYGKWLLQKLGLMVLLLLNFNFKFTVQFPTPSCYPLREKCPYSEFFWGVFSFIRTDYGQMLRISPYLVWMKENTNQKKLRLRTFFKQWSLNHYKFIGLSYQPKLCQKIFSITH